MSANEVDSIKILGKWKFTKVRDNRWGGWWYNYSCSECGWTTRTNPANLKECPQCGEHMEDYIDGSNQ